MKQENFFFLVIGLSTKTKNKTEQTGIDETKTKN